MNELRAIKARFFIFAIIMVAFICVAFAQLANYQLTDNPSQSSSQSTYYVKESVSATRGLLTDRYGRILVDNTVSYELSIDTSDINKNELNSVIMQLTSLCKKYGHEYTDTLPVIKYEPYEYLAEQTSTQSSRLAKYIKQKGWATDISASELISKMMLEYSVSEEYTAEEIRTIVGVRYELDLRKMFSSTIPSYVFCDNIGIELITVLSESNIDGVEISSAFTREYTTNLASHILGRYGLMSDSEYETYKNLGYSLNSKIGKDGSERAFESYLRGTDGVVRYTYNDNGELIDMEYVKTPEAGNNVALTIDMDLQKVVEDTLKNTIEDLVANGEQYSGAEAEGGAAVVIDVKNSEILAMASYPTYNLETFSKDFSSLNADPLSPMLNRAIAGLYSPGSTFKMITAIAALEGKVISSSSKIRDEGIYAYYKDYQPQCYLFRSSGRTHGSINVIEALAVSCNYFFYEVGRLIGIDSISKIASSFGLGDYTGIELSGEKKGSVAGPEYADSKNISLVPGDTLAASIGQSYTSVTPLQIANYVAALANGGTLHSAHILKNVKTYDNSQVVYEQENITVNEVTYSSSTHKTIMSGMLSATQSGGTAYSNFGRTFAFKVGAKTGSAQSSKANLDNSVFVAFAPYDDPEIAVCVVIEYGGTGGNASPVAKAAIDAYFDIKNSITSVTVEGELIK